MSSRVLIFLIVLCIGTATGVGAFQLPFPGELGPYEIGFSEFTILDFSRTDTQGNVYQVQVALWYPVDAEDSLGRPEAVYEGLLTVTSDQVEEAGFPSTLAAPPVSKDGPFPLVIMVGGGPGSSRFAHAYTNFVLASHGFVAATPARPPSPVQLTLLDGPKDVSLIIDRILFRNNTPDDLLQGKIDPESIAVGGHSLGGAITYSIAGGYRDKFDTNGEFDPENSTGQEVPADLRVKAIITMDGSSSFFPRPDEDLPPIAAQLLSDQELGRIEIPTLILGEHRVSKRNANLARPLEDRRPIPAAERTNLSPFEQIAASQRYLAEIKGSRHNTFGSTCGDIFILQTHPELIPLFDALFFPGFFELIVEDNPQCFRAPDPFFEGVNFVGGDEGYRLISLYLVAFLKKHLLGDGRYQRYLTKGYAVANHLPVDFSRRGGNGTGTN